MKKRLFLDWDDEEDEEWEEEVFLKDGTGYANESDTIDTKAYRCPRCRKVLFSAEVTLHGVIFIRCKRCKREVSVETKPKMRKIGF